MAEPRTDIAPAGWQITATTISCDMVQDYITVLVYQDWSCRCTWWAKYKKVADEEPRHRFPREARGKIGKCQGPDCKYVIGYRDKLIAEESAAGKKI